MTSFSFNKFLIPICYAGVVISTVGEIFFDINMGNSSWFFLIMAGMYEIQEKLNDKN